MSVTPFLGMSLPDDGAPGWGDDIRAGLVTIDQVIAAIQASGATEFTLRRLANNLNFARDLNDQLRVTITGQSNLGGIQWLNGGGWNSYYAFGAPNSMDVREQQRIAARQAVELRRNQRWTFT